MRALLLLLPLLTGCGDKDSEAGDAGNTDNPGAEEDTATGGLTSDTGPTDPTDDTGTGAPGGTTDTGCETATFYTDADDDGYGDPASPVEACEKPDGTVSNDRDCDDGDDQSWPGADEICDSADNDCDDAADEGLAVQTWWADLDADGSGDPASPVEACAQPEATADNDHDCDDADAATPRFVDGGGLAGDGSPASPFPTLQEAVESGASCVVVAPGTYGSVIIDRYDVSIVAEEGPEQTTIDAGGDGACVAVLESADVTLEGFTLTGGWGYEEAYSCSGYDGCYYHYGGGVYSESAGVVTLRDLVIEAMQLPYDVYEVGPSSFFRYGYGGGVAALGGSLVMEDVVLSDLFAVYGAGVYAQSAEVSMTRVRMEAAQGYIGGIYVSGGALEASALIANGNEVGYASLYLVGSEATLEHLTFADNSAPSGYSSVDIRTDSSPTTLRNSILAFNAEYGLYDSGGYTTASYCDLYGAGRSDFYSVVDEPLDGMISEDPEFVGFRQDLTGGDDLTLATSSPAVDKGDPSSSKDTDGSAADMGAYGGPYGF